MEPESLKNVFDNVFNEIGQARESLTPKLAPQEIGSILTVSTGIASVSGLPTVGFDELIKFPGDLFGIAFNVDEKEIGTVCWANIHICMREIKLNALDGLWMLL